MKTTHLLAVLAVSLLFSCKSKTENKDTADSTGTENTATTTQTTPAPETQATNEPKSYEVTFSPDSVFLGKQKEAAIKVLPGTATELTSTEGKSEGIELTFKLSLTNKNKIGGNSVGVSPSDFRLLLDNNNSISQQNGSYVSADAESTKDSENITYRLPAGTKPKSLKLFYDETRASVDVVLK